MRLPLATATSFSQSPDSVATSVLISSIDQSVGAFNMKKQNARRVEYSLYIDFRCSEFQRSIDHSLEAKYLNNAASMPEVKSYLFMAVSNTRPNMSKSSGWFRWSDWKGMTPHECHTLDRTAILPKADNIRGYPTITILDAILHVFQSFKKSIKNSAVIQADGFAPPKIPVDLPFKK